jgi:hypothetical protein
MVFANDSPPEKRAIPGTRTREHGYKHIEPARLVGKTHPVSGFSILSIRFANETMRSGSGLGNVAIRRG